jgi:hypothetical protein
MLIFFVAFYAQYLLSSYRKLQVGLVKMIKGKKKIYKILKNKKEKKRLENVQKKKLSLIIGNTCYYH